MECNLGGWLYFFGDRKTSEESLIKGMHERVCLEDLVCGIHTHYSIKAIERGKYPILGISFHHVEPGCFIVNYCTKRVTVIVAMPNKPILQSRNYNSPTYLSTIYIQVHVYRSRN